MRAAPEVCGDLRLSVKAEPKGAPNGGFSGPVHGVSSFILLSLMFLSFAICFLWDSGAQNRRRPFSVTPLNSVVLQHRSVHFTQQHDRPLSWPFPSDRAIFPASEFLLAAAVAATSRRMVVVNVMHLAAFWDRKDAESSSRVHVESSWSQARRCCGR